MEDPPISAILCRNAQQNLEGGAIYGVVNEKARGKLKFPNTLIGRPITRLVYSLKIRQRGMTTLSVKSSVPERQRLARKFKRASFARKVCD